jgi:N6-adenosine-specific RNA methylase IME4
MITEKEIGRVIHFFSQLNVAGIQVTQDSLEIGDTLHFCGHTTNFEEAVSSIQKKNKDIKVAKKNDIIGIPVHEKARKNDKVFKIVHAIVPAKESV